MSVINLRIDPKASWWDIRGHILQRLRRSKYCRSHHALQSASAVILREDGIRELTSDG